MYINPIEILGLGNFTDANRIDNDVIKREKRKLFADIDLSDNETLEYHGLHISKGNCEQAIDKLINNDIKEFYLYLANNIQLNEYLVNGNDAFYNSFKLDSIFKLKEFVKFISPYFAVKFDKSLLISFEKNNITKTKSILNTIILIEQTEINIAFKSVSNSIQNNINEIDLIKIGSVYN